MLAYTSANNGQHVASFTHGQDLQSRCSEAPEAALLSQGSVSDTAASVAAEPKLLAFSSVLPTGDAVTSGCASACAAVSRFSGTYSTSCSTDETHFVCLGIVNPGGYYDVGAVHRRLYRHDLLKNKVQGPWKYFPTSQLRRARGICAILLLVSAQLQDAAAQCPWLFAAVTWQAKSQGAPLSRSMMAKPSAQSRPPFFSCDARHALRS